MFIIGLVTHIYRTMSATCSCDQDHENHARPRKTIGAARPPYSCKVKPVHYPRQLLPLTPPRFNGFTVLDMDEFVRTIQEKTGLVLSPPESTKLFMRYHDDKLNVVNYNKFFADIKSRIEDEGGSAVQNTNKDGNLGNADTALSFDLLAQSLCDKLESKAHCTPGKDSLKKYFQLLSENHSPVVTKAQLKKACSARLALTLRDVDIDEIFRKLDPINVGIVNTRILIGEVLKKRKVPDFSIDAVGKHEHRAKTPEIRGSEAARMSHDNRILNLQAPNPVDCRAYTVAELESFVRDKITERSTLSHNMAKTALRLFGDGGRHSGDPTISFDQVRFTFWKKLRLEVAERDLEKFWAKYSKNGSVILMSDLTNGIIRDLGTVDPIIEDHALSATERAQVAVKIHQNNSLESFFTSLRQHINELINRESRAPHYLLHGTTKMTADQARLYFKKKLQFDIDAFSAELVSQVLHAYSANNLVDVKRILTEAMSIKDPTVSAQNEPVFGTQTLLNGSMVTVTKMPASLKQLRMSPEAIESILRAKCNERLKDSLPHASLYKMFRDSGADTKTITRKGMLKVLNLLDIITDERDFEAFSAKHDRGDGNIDIHEFLRRLLPADNVDSNAFVPKDPAVAHTEVVISNALRQVTGHQREVGNLNGTVTSRLDMSFINDMSGGSSRADTAPQDEHRSVDDVLEHLRKKRLETEAERTGAVSRPASPRAPASPSRAGAPPGTASPRAGTATGTVPPGAASANIADQVLRFDDSVSFSVVHNHFPPSALRPGSAPAGRRVTGTQLSKSLPGKRGEDAQFPPVDMNINGAKVERRSVSPPQKSPTLQVGIPDNDYLKGVLQSSLRNALRDMTLQDEAPVRTSVSGSTDTAVRPASASSTVRPRSSTSTTTRGALDGFSTATPSTVESAAPHRVQQNIQQAEKRDATEARLTSAATATTTASTATVRFAVAIPAPKASTPTATPREAIEIVSRYSQQVLRPSSGTAAKRPNTAPTSRVRASPRVVVQSDANGNEIKPVGGPSPGAVPETHDSPRAKAPILKQLQKLVVSSLAGIGDAAFTLPGGPPVPQAPEPPVPKLPLQELPAPSMYVLDPHYAEMLHSHTGRSSNNGIKQATQLGRTTYATAAPGVHSDTRSRPEDTARFVYTGQRRTVRTDPMNAMLACQYKISKNHITTTSHEYGAFANAYARSMQKNSKLHEKLLQSGGV